MSNEQQIPDALDPVAELVRAGGRRANPPAETYRTVLAAAEATWRRKLARRRRWRVNLALAAAAALGLVAVGLHQMPWWSAARKVEVARIDRIEGQVERRAPGSGRWTTLSPQDPAVAGGSRLRTGLDSGVGLLLGDGLSLRVAAESEIELTDERRVMLRHGTVYVQSAPDGVNHLDVDTAYGMVRHLGTQYELHTTAVELRIRVREGRVVLERDAIRVQATAGEQLRIATSGVLERSAIAAHDPAWRWTESLAPMPPLDGRPARVLLEWAARETGRELHYSDTTAEGRAAQVVLHGQLGRLSPSEAVAVLAATTDLDCRFDDGGKITVDAR